MDQIYYVSLVKIIYEKNLDNVINSKVVTGFILNVVQKVPTSLSPIGFLTDANFKLFINNVETEVSTNCNLVNLDFNGNYELTFDFPKIVKKGDYVVISINQGSTISNKLFIDFDALTDNLGEYKIQNYTITTPGTYYFILDHVDGININKRSSYAYTFVGE